MLHFSNLTSDINLKIFNSNSDLECFPEITILESFLGAHSDFVFVSNFVELGSEVLNLAFGVGLAGNGRWNIPGRKILNRSVVQRRRFLQRVDEFVARQRRDVLRNLVRRIVRHFREFALSVRNCHWLLIPGSQILLIKAHI